MLIIGICGGTGSGKTTVVNKILEILPSDHVVILSQDSYYKDNSHIPPEERKLINFDHPNSIEFDLLYDHIVELKKGNSIRKPVYSYITCTRDSVTIPVHSKEVILIEGILLFSDERIRNICNVKVFVDAPADERLLRVIRRDHIERGRTVEQTMDRYVETVKPMHEQFIEPTKRFADMIVPLGGENTVAINILASTIRQKLGLKKDQDINSIFH
ncbi:MAG: uridine kinase [Bacteroidota bacterium]|jgi:uridine kinase|nr:uridine kinase [Bacteroidota bacterium]